MVDTKAVNDLSSPALTTRLVGVLRRKLPYFIVLALAVLGVAYTSIAQRPLYGYWEFLGLAVGAACVAIGWNKLEDRAARLRLAWTQVLHWAAFLLAMNIVLWPTVNTFLNGPATGLTLLLLLALGTFVAGIHVSADIAFLGVALALTVPIIAWFKQTALLLVLGLLIVGGLVMSFVSRQSSLSPPPRA